MGQKNRPRFYFDLIMAFAMHILKVMTKKKRNKITRTSDIPVSAKMLYEVRDQLQASISSTDNKVASVALGVASNAKEIASNRHAISSNQYAIQSLEKKMDARFDELKADFHKALVIAEQQANENRYTMDKLRNLEFRQDNLQEQVTKDIAEIKFIIQKLFN